MIDRSPHVKNVKLPDSLETIDWAYFSTALTRTNTWKLHSLVPPRSSTFGGLNDQANMQYLQCLSHLCHSLRTLTLTKGLIATDNYASLQQFANLTSLVVYRDVVDYFGSGCT